MASFGYQGDYRGGFCEKAKLFSGGSSTTGITHSRRGKKPCTIAAGEESENVRATTTQTPRSVKKSEEEEAEEEVLHPQNPDSSAICGTDHGEAAVPLQTMEVKN